LRSLLAYATDIGFQYTACGFGAAAVYPHSRGRLLFNAADNTGWVAVAVDNNYDFTLLPEPNRFNFAATYQEVEMPKDRARESFGLFAEELRGYRFYEMRTPIDVSAGVDAGVLIRCLRYPLEGFFEPRLIADSHEFAVSRPFVNAAGVFK